MINKCFDYRRAIGYFCAFLLLSVCAIVFNKQYTNTFAIDGINYDSNINKPVRIKSDPGFGSNVNELDIGFSFKNRDKSFQFGNAFQTADGRYALRTEIQSPNKLLIIFGDGGIHETTVGPDTDVWHNVRVIYKSNDYLEVKYDNKTVLSLSKDLLSTQSISLDTIVVGAGYNHSRYWNGQIKDFELRATYTSKPLWSVILSFLFSTLACALLIRFCIAEKCSVNKDKLNSTLIAISAFFVSLALIFLQMFMIKATKISELGLIKWIPYITSPFAFVVAWGISERFTRNKFLNLSMVILLAIVLCIAVVGNFKSYYLLPEAFLFFSIFYVSYRWFKYQGGLMALAAIAPLVSTYNFEYWADAANSYGIIVYVPTVLIILGTALFIDSINKYSACIRTFQKKYIFAICAIFTVMIYVLLSFRSDSLFDASSAYHWEYFIGPIKSAAAGFQIINEIPSQYGFLNLLLPSFIPIESKWQSFYIFQSSTLLLISVVIYLLLANTTKSFAAALFISILWGLAFFYADPNLIGPAPYPSSSVMRFFPLYVYLIIGILSSSNVDMRKFHIAASIPMMIWSAESALYSVIVMLSVIVFSAYDNLRKKFDIRKVLTDAGSYFLILMGALSLFEFVYFIYYHQLFAYTKLFTYAIGYASGFGYVPFDWKGPWIVFLLIVIYAINVIKTNTLSSQTKQSVGIVVGVIYSLATYYIGRPVHQNFTAMLPLIFVSFILLLIISVRTDADNSCRMGISGSLLSVSVLILITLSTPTFYSKFYTFHSYTSNIEEKLPVVDDDLRSLLLAANVNCNAPIVIHGDLASMPLRKECDKSQSSTAASIPTPMQLLHDPLPERVRESYINSFGSSSVLLCELSYLVHERSSLSGNFEKIRSSLLNFYTIDKISSIGKYELYTFLPIRCQSK